MSEFTAITATIPTSTIEKLEEKIRKVNAKGGTFRYRVTGTTTIKRHIDYEGIPKVVQVHASIVEVIGQQNNVDGSNWNFVAHIDHATSPAIVTAGNDDEQTVALYRYFEQRCDHCGHNRDRRYTYIAENVNTGNRVQVGSTCLKAYFGNVTAESLISAATFLRQIPQWFDDDEFQGTTRPYFPTMNVLAGAAQSVFNRGFHKTTGVDVPTRVDAPFIKPISPEAIELAEKAAVWIKTQTTQNDYLLNLQAAVSSEWIDYRKHGGILVSLIPAYQRAMAKIIADNVKEAARTEDCPNDANRHQVTGTLISIKEVDDYYGIQLKMLVEADGGYRVYGTCPQSIADAESGDRVTFACKIEHKAVDFGFIKRPTKAKILDPA